MAGKAASIFAPRHTGGTAAAVRCSSGRRQNL